MLGIHFSIESNRKIQPVLTTNQDNDVLFADRVLKMSPDFKLIQFQLIITKKRFYLFKESSGNIKEQVTLKTIDNVNLSHQSDNFLLIRLQDRDDIFLVSRRKIEIISVLSKCWDRSSVFPLAITDRFRYTHPNGNKYAIIFLRTEHGVDTEIYLEIKSNQVDPKKKVE